jgi:hypothetical protein
MRRFRFLLPVTTWCLAALLPPAPAQQPAQPPPSAPLPPPKEDLNAVKEFDLALAALGPQQLKWVQTTLWQEAHFQGLVFRAHGRYLAGPDQRLRLELQVQLGGADGRMEVASDGRTLWQALRVGPGDRLVSTVDLPPILEALRRAPGTAERNREDFFLAQTPAFAGLKQLLQGLKKQLTFTRLETVAWNACMTQKRPDDRPVKQLTAVWSADTVKTAIGSPDESRWPGFLARKCRIFLDPDTHWPLRLEWWGPGRAGESLLLQMEFRDPVLNQPIPDAEFTLKIPGDARVQDFTKEWLERVTAAAAQPKGK